MGDASGYSSGSIALCAIYYISWPWWFPLKELVGLISNIDADHGTSLAVVIAVLSLGVSVFGSVFVALIINGLLSSFFCCMLAFSLAYCWLAYGIALAAVELFF
jgi:hypothetical protein